MAVYLGRLSALGRRSFVTLPTTRLPAVLISCPTQPSFQMRKFSEPSTSREQAKILEKALTHPPPPFDNEDQTSEKVKKLVDEILRLPFIEVIEFTNLLGKKLGINPNQIVAAAPAAAAPATAAPAAAAPATPGADAANAAAKPAVEEKTHFKLKLVSVEGGTSAKFKIIKEIRSLNPNLGLAECKTLVDTLPAVLGDSVPKQEAEAIAARIKEAGATVSLE